MADKNTSLRRLLKFFNLTLDNQDKSKPPILSPGFSDPKTGQYRAIKFPSDVQRAIDYFLQNSQIYNPNRDRYELYKSLLFMVRNSGLMLSALQTYISETIDMNNGEKPIQIKALNKDVETYFYKWLDNIGFNYNMLNELVYDLVLLGDSFLMHSLDLEDGIVEVVLIDPFVVKDRIELNLNKATEFAQWASTSRNYINRYQSLSQISNMILNKTDLNEVSLNAFEYYKSYTMGYELKYSADNDQKYRAIPPWDITHFRLFTTKSEFFPFGRPLFINSLAPFQSFKTTEMLIDMLRVASFPKEVIKIKGGASLSPLDRMNRVNETRQFIENLTPNTNTKDNLAVGERIYTMDDLFAFEVIDSNIDLGKLGDLEAKLTDLILSTAIPDSLLIPSRGAGGIGGENAHALYFNNKLFQRRVESIKSAIIEGFSNMFRLHLTITEDFAGEQTEFELSMPINSEMFNSEKITQLQDIYTLADLIVSNLSNALGVDQGQLPEEVLKDIFKTYLPLDGMYIEKWLEMIKAKKEEDKEQENGEIPAEEGEEVPVVEEPTVEETPPEEDLSAVITGDENKVAMIRKSMAKEDPESTMTKIQKIRNKLKKKDVMVEKFLKDYNNGDDALLREAYFKAKKELGMTQGWLGKFIYWNDSYKKSNFGSLSIYNLLREEKNNLLNKKLHG